MKIRALGTIKHGGKHWPPGTEIDADNGLADQLIRAKAAELVLVEPPAEMPSGVNKGEESMGVGAENPSDEPPPLKFKGKSGPTS
jgi:hypothetical protein